MIPVRTPAAPAVASAIAHGWIDGSYTNPIIPGLHPDPSICRVGDDYYLACSSFEYYPGVPIFHSRDLVHWEQVGNALDRPSQLSLPTTMPSSAGVYAPTLRHHDGRFWLITTNVADGGGTLIVTTTDPAGPWSEPVWTDVPGIDPDIAWDDEGRCWCTYAGVEQVPIDPETGRVLGSPRRLWSGTPGAQAPEAPHLYHIGDHWYLLIAEGGTERGHAVSIARGLAPAARSSRARTTPSSATAAPTGRSRIPATPTWSRHPTARGGWCCWAYAQAVVRRAGTCSAGRRTWRP
jgi:beta-xylosidase